MLPLRRLDVGASGQEMCCSPKQFVIFAALVLPPNQQLTSHASKIRRGQTKLYRNCFTVTSQRLLDALEADENTTAPKPRFGKSWIDGKRPVKGSKRVFRTVNRIQHIAPAEPRESKLGNQRQRFIVGGERVIVAPEFV